MLRNDKQTELKMWGFPSVEGTCFLRNGYSYPKPASKSHVEKDYSKVYLKLTGSTTPRMSISKAPIIMLHAYFERFIHGNPSALGVEGNFVTAYRCVDLQEWREDAQNHLVK